MVVNVQDVVNSIPLSVFVLFGLAIGVRVLFAVCRLPNVKGAIGEGLVSRCLRYGLGKDAVVLDDVYLPLPDGTTTQIDHVVVCPQGVFSIETKNYAGWIFGDEKARMWTQVHYRQKHRFQNPMRQNNLHVRTLVELLSLEPELVQGLVVFIGGCTFKTGRPRGVCLPGEIAERIRTFRNPVLSASHVSCIADGIAAFAATVTKEQRAAHVDNLRQRH